MTYTLYLQIDVVFLVHELKLRTTRIIKQEGVLKTVRSYEKQFF
jgi:hypothetical protein